MDAVVIREDCVKGLTRILVPRILVPRVPVAGNLEINANLIKIVVRNFVDYGMKVLMVNLQACTVINDHNRFIFNSLSKKIKIFIFDLNPK